MQWWLYVSAAQADLPSVESIPDHRQGKVLRLSHCMHKCLNPFRKPQRLAGKALQPGIYPQTVLPLSVLVMGNGFPDAETAIFMKSCT